jgi:hypothetical protein
MPYAARHVATRSGSASSATSENTRPSSRSIAFIHDGALGEDLTAFSTVEKLAERFSNDVAVGLNPFALGCAKVGSLDEEMLGEHGGRIMAG